MPAFANVPSSLSPAGTVIERSGSPLISMVTSPELTNLERADRMMKTSDMTITVNMATPIPIICVSIILLQPYNLLIKLV
jgi:hypothetical protein